MIAPATRVSRLDLTGDGCVIDEREFFVKGLLSLPIQGTDAVLTWGVWVSLSESDFHTFARVFEDVTRVLGVSFLGWLSNSVPGFESSEPLAAKLHVRAYPLRPWVEQRLQTIRWPLRSAKGSRLRMPSRASEHCCTSILLNKLNHARCGLTRRCSRRTHRPSSTDLISVRCVRS